MVLFQRPMTTVFRKPWGDEEELLARWADERCGRGDLSRPAGPGWGNGWPVGPTCWWAVCGGDPGGWFFAGVGCVHPCFLAPLQGAFRMGWRGPGVVAALDPRLPSGTPTGVGRAGIGRCSRGASGIGIGLRRWVQPPPYSAILRPWRAMKNGWPVGPTNDVVGAPFSARWAGKGQ